MRLLWWSFLTIRENAMSEKTNWLAKIVYVLFAASLVWVGWTLRGNDNQSYVVPPSAIATSITSIPNNLELEPAGPQQIIDLLNRYRRISGESAERWQVQHNRTLSGKEVDSYRWIILNIMEHPCPLPERFVAKQAEKALETALKVKLIEDSK